MSLRRLLGPFGRKPADWNQCADFFNFTRGRFVCRENEEMAERHIAFDMNELCKVAGASVGKACVKVEKYADGLYNKAFLLTMDNDEQVVAKVPNPNAGLPHFTTASEVATMDLMHNVLDTPAPRVFAWDSSDKNAVKAEYIIMEKVNGVQLSTVWPSMRFDQKVKVMKTIARYQTSWARVSFSRIGSLYYANDVETNDRPTPPLYVNDPDKSVSDARFAIGPIVSKEWNSLGRGRLNSARGPWKTSEAYRRAMIERDCQAVGEIRPLPKSIDLLCGPRLYQSTPEKKLRACEAALQALPHVLPQAQWASSFHLWHDDLHHENIFVDAQDHSAVVGVIDWQSSFVAPLFDHIIIPAFLSYDGQFMKGLERPSPPDLSELDADAEAAVIRLHDSQLLVSGLKYLLHHTAKKLFEAQMYEESDESDILNASRNIYEVGEGLCLHSLATLESSLVDLSRDERDSIEEDAQRIMDSVRVMTSIKEHLGGLFPEKGVVRPDQYEDAKAALRSAKAQVIEEFSKSDEDRAAWEEAWPFDD